MSVAGTNQKMYVVDAHSLIYQVFHAIPEMSSPKGVPTNALFGFTRDLLYLRLEKKPDYLVCAFDTPGPTFRDKIYAEYKAHRKPMPDELKAQIPLIYQMVEAMRIPLLSKEGFEADDLLATVARAGSGRGIDVFLCTTDKDCRQLIDDRVTLYNLRKHAVLDRAALQADWGVTPEQVVDLQTLVGDSVDNVPGVPGIGLKTAAKLLQEFGTLEGLLAQIDRIPGAKKQENLKAAAEFLPRSRQLIRLADDVPIDMDWDGWKLQPWDAPRLLALFQEFGFRSFADQVRKAEPVQAPTVTIATPRQGELFPIHEESANGQSEPAPTDALYHLVNTAAGFKDFLGKLRKQKRFSIDVETTGLDPVHSLLVGISVSWSSAEAYYLAIRGPEGEPVLDETATLAALKPILEDAGVAKVNQNIKYDLLAFRGKGIRLAGVAGDPMVADYLLHAGERSHSIADLANRYLRYQVMPITDLIGKKGKNQLRLDQVATARVTRYSGEDADIAWRLTGLLEEQVRATGLQDLYANLEIPLIEVLAELEFNGIRLDLPLLAQLSKDMALQLAAMEREIHGLAGREFNIASPKQLREVLFNELSLPAQRKTGITGEASTDSETLERLAALGHPLPLKILDYRQVAKLKGTYVDALPALVNPATGRIHASFNQTVASTGRLSSSDPNLQNIPVRREQGRQIRQAFLPEPGWVLIAADYSQIELRLLAHFSGDQELGNAFAQDRDVHTLVAGQIFGVPEAEVTEEMRRTAKTVNFGVIYGMSAHGLAQRLHIPREEAEQFIDAYFARYPRVLEYQSRLLENCRRDRYVCTILGRRREITGVRPETTYQQRNQPEREAINMEIQGSAADLIKLAMLHIQRRLERESRRTRMLMQIHDELVFEAPPEELALAARLVREEMTATVEKALNLKVPLKVEVAAGANWLDVETIEEER